MSPAVHTFLEQHFTLITCILPPVLVTSTKVVDYKCLKLQFNDLQMDFYFYYLHKMCRFGFLCFFFLMCMDVIIAISITITALKMDIRVVQLQYVSIVQMNMNEALKHR